METTVPIAIAVGAALLLVIGAIADDRRARIRRRRPARVELPLLHSINDDRCIGCEACVDVCPTEVLELVHHKARVVRFSDCVQCEQCMNACPTTALVMYREGNAPQTLTVPELDDHFQTGVPGQYLIGEVAGKPLVKNAANLGRAVIEHVARQLDKRGGGDVLDVAIVGSGPGGLSAGLTCFKHGLSCVVIEKEHVLASTVARYPKGKLFMAEPVDSGNVSYLPVFDATKEELVAAWKKVVDGVQLSVKLGEAVESVKRGDDGVFTIKTTVATYRARAVVLATGLRGKPRLLAVPGANLEKVQSRLDDPDEFAGRDVLVVGGGDSAVEGAMSLADAGARVALSYRGDGFKRCKQGNQKRLAEMTAANRLEVLLESNVTQFTEREVSIKLKDGTVRTLPNQRAFVMIGADTPIAWLEANHVRFIERPHLYALGSTEDVVRQLAPDAVECAKTSEDALAALKGRKSRHRLRTVVDDLVEVVTSVTNQVFRFDENERDSKHKRTSPWGTPALPTPKRTAPKPSPQPRGTVVSARKPTTAPFKKTEPVVDPFNKTVPNLERFDEERARVGIPVFSERAPLDKVRGTPSASRPAVRAKSASPPPPMRARNASPPPPLPSRAATRARNASPPPPIPPRRPASPSVVVSTAALRPPTPRGLVSATARLSEQRDTHETPAFDASHVRDTTTQTPVFEPPIDGTTTQTPVFRPRVAAGSSTDEVAVITERPMTFDQCVDEIAGELDGVDFDRVRVR
jgi:thioredoxin reductase/ferredoxin